MEGPYESAAESENRKTLPENPDSDNAAVGTDPPPPLIRVFSGDLSPDEIEKLLEDVRCPECLHNEGDPDGDPEGDPADDRSGARLCKRCNRVSGSDDSTYLDDLGSLILEHKVAVRLTTKCACDNDDVDKFDVTAIDDVTGQLTVRCQLCCRSMEFGTFQNKSETQGIPDFQNRQQHIHDDNATDDIDSFSENPRSPLVCSQYDDYEYDLFKKQRGANKDVTSFTCLVCPEPEVTPTRIVCPVCRNDKDEIFRLDDGRSPSVACGDCLGLDDVDFGTVSPGSISAKDRIKTRKRQVQSIDDVTVGDHVTWHRDYAVWHHAIVTVVKPRDRKLTVVHYTGSPVRHRGHYASVRAEDVEVDPRSGERLFVHDYYAHDGLHRASPPSEVVARAMSRVGEHRYNPFSRNCEHFAYWCKTGLEYSSQTRSFFRRLWKTCGSDVSAAVREGIINAARGTIDGIPAKRALGIGFKEGLGRLRELSVGGGGGGSDLAAKLVGGAVAFDVLLNVAFEAGLFAYCAERAQRKWKAGEITTEEYHRRVIQSGCECLGGLLGATGGGFLGQLAIPVPVVGGVVGCTLGSLIGRFVGTVVGKKFADRFVDKK